MPNTAKPYAIVAAAVLGLALLGWIAYSVNRTSAGPAAPAVGAPPGGKPGGPPGGFAMAVETARVAAVDFVDEARAVGSLRSNESVVLRPETAGRIAQIGFKDGSRVAKGTLLVSLDAAMQEAELAQAKANFALAQSNFKRSEDLVAKKFLSQQSLDSAAANLRVQEAQVQLAAAKLERMRIRAPFAGVVGIRNVSVGDYVKDGQELINLEDLATMKVDFRLPELYLERLQKGQAIELVSDALPGEVFAATLDAINPLVDAGGRSIACRARLNNPGEKLKPGMFVRVRLTFGERKGALMIPEQAVVTGGRPMVYQVVEGKAKAVPVKLGARQQAQVEVLEGLAAGDVVVTAGHMRLKDGAAVRAVGEGAAGAKPEAAAPASAPGNPSANPNANAPAAAPANGAANAGQGGK